MSEYLQKKYLAHLKPVANTTTLYYTCPAFNVATIDSIFVNNLDYQDNSDLVSIRIVPHGASVGDDYALLSNYELKIGENCLKDKITL